MSSVDNSSNSSNSGNDVNDEAAFSLGDVSSDGDDDWVDDELGRASDFEEAYDSDYDSD
jgi:hypothetical protein